MKELLNFNPTHFDVPTLYFLDYYKVLMISKITASKLKDTVTDFDVRVTYFFSGYKCPNKNKLSYQKGKITYR